jgi:hypothetical protein
MYLLKNAFARMDLLMRYDDTTDVMNLAASTTKARATPAHAVGFRQIHPDTCMPDLLLFGFLDFPSMGCLPQLQ